MSASDVFSPKKFKPAVNLLNKAGKQFVDKPSTQNVTEAAQKNPDGSTPEQVEVEEEEQEAEREAARRAALLTTGQGFQSTLLADRSGTTANQGRRRSLLGS